MSNDTCNTDGFLSTIVPPALAVGGAIGAIVLETQLLLPPPVAVSLTAGAAVSGYGYGKALTVTEEDDARFWRTMTGATAGVTMGIAGSQILQGLIAPDANKLVFVGAGGGLGFLAGDLVIAPVLTPGTRIGRGVVGLADSVSGLLGYAACEVSTTAAAGLGEIKDSLAPPPLKCKNGRPINQKRAWIKALRKDPVYAAFVKPLHAPSSMALKSLMNEDPAWFGSPDNEEMVIDPGLLTRLKQGAKGLLFGAIGFIRGATATKGTVSFAGCMTPAEFVKTRLFKEKWKPWIIGRGTPAPVFGPGQPGQLPPVFGGPPAKQKGRPFTGIGPAKQGIDPGFFSGQLKNTSRV